MTTSKLVLNPRVISARYAVRGVLPQRADIIQSELDKDPKSHSFPNVTYLNIGNPQQLDQQPLTYVRQVLSLVQYPALMDVNISLFPKDALTRAKRLLKSIGSVGAYSHSKGVPVIREAIAEFIEKRDGFSSDPEDIFMTAGASNAVGKIMTLICSKDGIGMLVPVPQYPLYSATSSLVGAEFLGYSLDEEQGWQTGVEAIKLAYSKAKSENIDPRLLVVINPGNPTGGVMSREKIEEILTFARDHNLTIIADEVYQFNLFRDQHEFVSFKKVRSELAQKDPSYEKVPLASLNSTSKGFLGECGQRGGYVEVVGFGDEAKDELYKLASIELCPVVAGQVVTEIMVNPPRKGDESYELYNQERTAILERIESRGLQLFEAFKKMRGVSCQKPQGAMYLFPNIAIPEKAIQEAESKNMNPDTFYAMELLNQTGICVVPGSGFGQKKGTFHFRTTFLAPGGEDLSNRFIDFHNRFMDKYE